MIQVTKIYSESKTMPEVQDGQIYDRAERKNCQSNTKYEEAYVAFK